MIQRPHQSFAASLWRLVKVAVGAGLLLLRAGAFDLEHPEFAKVLGKFVSGGLVDYQGLKAAPQDLDEYLDQLAGVSREQFEIWPERDRLAFLINLYNATTLKLITDNYPVKGIRSIGGFFSSPWKQRVVHIWGENLSLDDVEHTLIRARFKEPRIHFALVCAARSCPPLRAEPYTGSRLAVQLDDQGRQFFAQPLKNRLDTTNKVLWLSPIFRWFEGDFTSPQTNLVRFVSHYLPITGAGTNRLVELKIKYTEYDWSLNEQPRR